MLTYYLVLFAVLVFAGAAQNADSDEAALQGGNVFWEQKVTHAKSAKFFYLFSSLVLICVAGFRFRVGTDFGGYFLYWEKYADQLYESIVTFDEPGYRLIAAFSRVLGFTNGQGAIFLASLITNGSILFVFYKYSNQLLLVSILFFLIFWVATFNGVRQCLAVSMVFCGYGALRDRKFWQYCAWVGVGWLFHHSAICMILVYFVLYSKISWRNCILLGLACIFVTSSYDLLFGFANSIMDKGYRMVEGSYAYKQVNILRVLTGVAPAIYFVAPKLARGEKVSKEQAFCMNILIMQGALCLVCMYSPCFYRMTLYFSPFFIMALAYLLKKTSIQYYKPLTICVCCLYMIMFFIEVGKSGSLNDFQFFWTNSGIY